MANRFYELQVAGCTRKLSILNISDKLAIAGFILLGDVELVTSCAAELAKRIPKDAEIIMTAETKGIPLAAELARQLGMKWYITARKSVKAYMENPLWVEDESITTKGKQVLCLMDADIERIKGKKVLILDDVISTGGSLRALEQLAEKAGGHVVGKAAVLAEGWPRATRLTGMISSSWRSCLFLMQNDREPHFILCSSWPMPRLRLVFAKIS